MGEKTRRFSTTELSKLSSKHNLHLLISGKVYDVHEFLHEHPGGDLVLVGEAGKDATKAFEDVQHTDEAKELMEEYLVGYCSEAAQTAQASSMTDIKPHNSTTRPVVKLSLSLLGVLCIILLLYNL